MESLFNAVWVLIAVSLVLVCTRQQRSRRLSASLITLACVLALLFPVISITDDLHAPQELFDDFSSRKILKSLDWHANDTPAIPSATIASAVFSPSPDWAYLPDLRISRPLEAHRADCTARAPPAWL